MEIERNLDILLISPSWADVNNKASHFTKMAAIVPPLGLCMLAALAERDGFKVGIIDGQASGLSFQSLVDEVIKLKPLLVGITATSPFFEAAIKLAKAIKQFTPPPLGIKIAIGGVHVTIAKEKAMESCFDYGFVGDAEISFPAFLLWMKKSNKQADQSALNEVKGVLYRQNDKIIFTGMPDEIIDLDKLPFPAFHLLDMNKYTIGTSNGRVRMASILTTRGCPFHCIFCAPIAGYNVRNHSAEYVLNYIEKCINDYDIRHFFFFDDTLTLKRKHIEDICNGIIKKGYIITLEGSTRANLVDESLLILLKRAGLIRLSFGLETVNESIRRTIKKEVPIINYIRANYITNSLGIETLNSCMIGLPGETIDSIRQTLSFLRFFRKEVQQANISIATPYPGTELAEMALQGKNQLALVDKDLNHLRRYGAAVMQVGQITPQQLIQLQNDAIVSIHIAVERWKIVVRKFGLKGLLLTFRRFVQAFPRLIINKDRLFFFNAEDFAPWKKLVSSVDDHTTKQ